MAARDDARAMAVRSGAMGRNHTTSQRAARLAAVAFTSVWVAAVGCKGGGGVTEVLVDTSGGSGSNGEIEQAGAMGGNVDVTIADGTAGSAIEILDSGAADAGFDFLIPAAEYGPVRIVIDEDLELWILAPGETLPDTSLYIPQGETVIRISNGDTNYADDPIATGIEVVRGATLTLPLNVGTGAALVFSQDVINDGVITVLDVDATQRGSISITTARNYIGDGVVEAHGIEPGQAGGAVDLTAGGALINLGTISSYGAAQSSGAGGAAGAVTMTAQGIDEMGWIGNRGAIRARGGASTGASGTGGAGADVTLVADQQILNAAPIDASGGNGIDLGGIGGRVWMRALLGGSILNDASLTSRGGPSPGGPGGEGGRISFEAHGGEIRSRGALWADGGRSTASPTAQGGRGGRVDFETNELVDPGDPRAGDITVSGGVYVGGGSAVADTTARGGVGGSVAAMIRNDHGSTGQSIRWLGFDRVTTSGGDGARIGSNAGDLMIAAGSDEIEASGRVVVRSAIDLSGGNSDPERLASAGGDGGDLTIAAATASRGETDLSGGAGQSPGANGVVVVP